MMKKKLLCISVLFAASFTAHADRLDEIQEAGIIRVGTTGDYKPFSSFDGKQFSGYDIDVAKYIAEQLDVKLELVQTSWKNLIPDLNADKYDIAMGGITRKIERQLHAEQSQGYMTFGKCFLVAKGKAETYNTIDKVNKSSTRLGINIGGTNEIFADTHLQSATFTRYKNNLDVPQAVATGKVDVMVTETPEALYYQATDKRLEASRCDDPFTKSQFGYLVPKGEQELLNAVNFIMDEMKLKGVDKKLMKKNALL
ncbi:transporter substrate-binding domain-containing protein [Aliivibrio fischeri]|uniref:transporter substrate-binding domain-containing protein n=1 Tax=Aliivibrio fischeri TaxID=668 RepID=UPI001F16D292|nr:transporter substrate-binding domain-containing protein [Aliivibrio fischeri]MCE7534809.1 transporter substrate-binding domain-containing protein [Aliivibrio fischeri]MCE7557355.1 transporter substrate-binding domain-containing protein [Aliivibrio fischeri]